ncbi:MAG: oligosaccharide flippase family protein [Acidobacteria bacterium]|nr:oligosaccharide flippase family protein [Acidobacteriota bacterium]
MTVSVAISSLLRVAFVVIAGRLLGPEQYAEFYAAVSIIFLLGTGLAPVGSSIARFTSLYVARGEMGKVASLRKTFPKRVFFGSLVLAGLGATLAVPLKILLGFESVATLHLVFAALVFTLLLSSPRGFMRGVQDFSGLGWNMVLEGILRLGVGLPLMHWVVSTSSGLGAYIFGAGAACLIGNFQISSIASDEDPVPADHAAVGRMMGPLFIFALVGAAYQNVDMLFVKRYFQPAEAGIYAAGSSLAKTVALAFLPFSIALLPMFTELYARGESLLKKLLLAATSFLFLAGAILAMLFFWGNSVLVMVYGPDYVEAERFLVPLGGGLALFFLSTMIGQAMLSKQSYGFLFPFSIGLLFQLALFWHYRTSIEALPWTVVAAQSALLSTLLVLLLLSEKGTRPQHIAEATSFTQKTI